MKRNAFIFREGSFLLPTAVLLSFIWYEREDTVKGNGIEEHRIEINGKQLFYRAAAGGCPQGTILYIHGNTGSSRWYERVMDLPGYRTIALDMPNFGRSDPIDTADIGVYADWVSRFCDALSLKGVTVVGHSLGGAVAMSMVLRRPDLADRLLLVDSAPPGGFPTPKEHYPVIEMYRTNRSLLTQALGAVAPALKDSVFLCRLVDDAMMMNGLAFVGNAEALGRFSCLAMEGNFGKPVLVIRGDMDILITADMARQTAEFFPAGRFEELRGVGHSVMVENPGLFLRILSAFVAGSGKRENA